MRIGIIDYEAGNIASVNSALKNLSSPRRFEHLISSDPKVLSETDKLIFPGVGEARAAMRVLEARGLSDLIRGYLASGKPILGICVGCQIAFDWSEESSTQCLGLVKGSAKLFSRDNGLKVPHMGWNNVTHTGHRLFEGIPSGASFYFVHSYYPAPTDSSHAISWTDYGINFVSGIAQDNFVAVQFHPEKSGKYGLRLLENFIIRG